MRTVFQAIKTLVIGLMIGAVLAWGVQRWRAKPQACNDEVAVLVAEAIGGSFVERLQPCAAARIKTPAQLPDFLVQKVPLGQRTLVNIRWFLPPQGRMSDELLLRWSHQTKLGNFSLDGDDKLHFGVSVPWEAVNRESIRSIVELMLGTYAQYVRQVTKGGSSPPSQAI